jgi:hypothetical protein
LRDALARAIDGQMTNDQFENLYYSDWFKSSDRAVDKIAQFGLNLFSNELLWPYRLTGRNAPSPENRQITERCLLFLQSDREYAWPEEPGRSPRQWLAGGAALVCLLPLILLAIVGGAMLVSGVWEPFVIVALMAIRLSVASGRAIKYFGSQDTPAWREWYSAGDFDYWPFLERGEYEQVLGARL